MPKLAGPHGHPHHDPHHLTHEPHLSSATGWRVPPPTMADLRPWFDSDEQTATAYAAVANAPEEQRAVLRLGLELASAAGATKSAAGDTETDTGIFLGSGRRQFGVATPSTDDLIRALGDAQLGHQVSALLQQPGPPEVAVIIAVLSSAIVGLLDNEGER